MSLNDVTPITNTSSYESAALSYEDWKNNFLRIVLRIASVLLLIAVISAYSVNTLSSNILYISLVAVLAISGLVPLPYSIRGLILLAALFVGGTNLLLLWGIEGEASMIYLGAICLTALLYEKRFEFITLAIIAVSILLVASLTINGQHILSGWSGLSDEFYAIMVASWIDWFVYLIDVSAVALILIYAIRLLKGKFNMILTEARKLLNELSLASVQLEDRVNQRTDELNSANQQISRRATQMNVIAELFESISQVQDMGKLLPTATGLISERFGFYHVGIFLVDNKKEYAVLQAANSEGGKRMLARRHRLRVGSEGIVGYVTGRGQTRIALNVGLDSAYFDNPDLPDTRSEIALPLKIAGETIGALDLQSTNLDAFAQEDAEVLSILSNQLAIAIQNARSFEAARQAAQDAETAYRQLTGETWSQLMRTRKSLGYYFDGVEAKSITENPHEENAQALTVPVRLRGREIGKLRLNSLTPGHTWSDDEIAIAESAAERAALSLENARLLEDAQRRAAREHTIGSISAQIGSFTQMEDVLRFAVEELGRKMGGAEVIVELGTE